MTARIKHTLFSCGFAFCAITTTLLYVDSAEAACSSPTANIGSLDFQTSVFKYCDGSSWVSMMTSNSFPLTGPNGTATGPTYSFSAGTNTGMYSLGPGTLAFTTAGTLAGVINNLGYHGIGTTAPGSLLDIRFGTNPLTDNGSGANAVRISTAVAEAANVGGAISLGGWSDATGANGHVAYGQIAGRKTNSTSGDFAGYLQFATNASNGTMLERMRIDNLGNVGIGTSAPTQALDIGSGAFRSGNLLISGTPRAFANPLTIGSDTLSAFMYLDSTYSAFRIGTQGASGYGSIDFELPSGAGYQDVMALSTTSLAPSGSFDNLIDLGISGRRWKSLTIGTGSATFQGSVGIGTTAPAFQFTNSAQTNVTDQGGWGLASSAKTFVWEHPSSDTNSGYGAAFLNSYTANNANGLLIRTSNTLSSSNILTLDSGGTDRLTVTGNGMVGIGTNNPQYTLDVPNGYVNALSYSVGGGYPNLVWWGNNPSMPTIVWAANTGTRYNGGTLEFVYGNSITEYQDSTTTIFKGTVQLGGTGSTSISGLGTCSIASFAAASGANSKTCTGVVAGAPITCSPSAAPATATTMWSAYASAANTVAIHVSAAFTTNTVWKCSFVNP